MSVQNLGNLGFFPGFGLMLGAVTKTFDMAIKQFNTTEKTEIVQAYTELGFESYDNLVAAQYYLGVSAAYIGSLKSVITRSLAIPADKTESFQEFLDFADVVDPSQWTNYQALLRTDNSGNCKSI
jgi:hypothetical protein